MKHALLCVMALWMGGCASTVIEKNVAGTAPLARNTGFLHWLYASDKKTIAGAAFNAEGHDNYNYLLGKFGKDLKPPRTEPDFGVTTDGEQYFLTVEACTDFGEMAGWDRSSEHAPKTLLQKVGL